MRTAVRIAVAIGVVLVGAVVLTAQSGGNDDAGTDAREVLTDRDVAAELECPSEYVQTAVVDHGAGATGEQLDVLVDRLEANLADRLGVVEGAEEMVGERERYVHLLDMAGRLVATYVVVNEGGGWAVAVEHTCGEAH